jgi:transcriptional regulator with XRE-family HTH domain
VVCRAPRLCPETCCAPPARRDGESTRLAGRQQTGQAGLIQDVTRVESQRVRLRKSPELLPVVLIGVCFPRDILSAYESERKRLLQAFAAKLRALREDGFATQEDLAHATKLHRTHIGYLEQGRREPSLSTLLILSETLGAPIERLAEGLPAPKRRQPARRGEEPRAALALAQSFDARGAAATARLPASLPDQPTRSEPLPTCLGRGDCPARL